MNELFKDAITALDALDKSIETTTAPSGLMTEAYGFHHPAFFKDDLKDIVEYVKNKIIKYGDIELSEDEAQEVSYLAKRINTVTTLIVPQLFNGNGAQAIPSFMSTFTYINMFLDDVFSMERLDKANLVPKNLSRKIKSLSARINEISPEVDNLDGKIKSINEAHAAAESMPIDLEQLRGYNSEASDLKGQINKILFELENIEKDGGKCLASLNDKNAKAGEYLSLCEKAIVASTSKGLAGAFEIKAKSLNITILAWIAGLMVALSAGGYIGFERLKVLSKVLENGNPSTAVIVTQLALSIFSVGAPLWFAWMSTKQINQRFKLAEDYAFKSAVAKAYEGYKNEAARVSDGEFEKRLFDSALTRLEEAPLRLLNDEEHTTPWAEMLSSKSFQKFLDASIDNVEYVKKLIGNKGLQAKTASNDNKIEPEQTKAEA